MINVNQITAQLARMPDQSLQQYAQMHKGDPYVLSLALAESNRRKELRQGAQMSVPPQPKVVDQEIQSMAAPMPEHVGIGQLPAGDMNFAEGGIVAFADGGVPRYAGEDDQLVRNPYAFLNPGDLAEKLARVFREGIDPEAAKKRREALIAASAGAGSPAEQAAINAALNSAGASTANLPAMKGAVPPPGAAPGAQGAGGAGPGQRVPPAGGPGASAPPAGLTALPVMQSPSQMFQAAQESVPLVDPAAAQREALGKELIGGAQRREQAFKEELEKEGDVFAPRAERLSQREAKLQDYESTNQSLALLNAGLAIMSTPGGLATAIGKGARVGTEQYAAGLDKLRAAQERLEEAKDSLDTLRLNRKDMTSKEARALAADVDRAKVDAQKLGIEGIMAASDLRHRQASELFKGALEQAKTQYTVAGELRGREIGAQATMAAANAPGAQERMFSRLGGGDLRKGMQTYSDIMGTEAKGENALIAAYAKDPIKLKLLEQTEPGLAQYIKSRMGQMMVPGVQTTPGAGPVRP